MKRLLIAGLAAGALLAGAASADAATTWPAKCTTMKCVNAHMNALHETQVAQAAKIKQIHSEADDAMDLASFATGGAFCASDAIVQGGLHDGQMVADAYGFECANSWWTYWTMSAPQPSGAFAPFAPAVRQLGFRP
jgi:hypothetical protein